jgi:putative flippase GtrA
MFKQELMSRLWRFGAVGGLVMLVFTGLNALIGLRMGRQAAFFLAYPPAVALHFWLSKKWTFQCTRTDFGRQFREYGLMVGMAFLVQWTIFSLLVSKADLPGWLAASLANVAQWAITFSMMHLRIFSSTK